MKSLRHSVRVGAVVLAAMGIFAMSRAARAESPALPPGAISGDTISLMYVSGPQISPEKISQTMTTTMGPDSLKLMNLARYASFYKAATDAGANSACLTVAWAAAASQPSLVVYLHVKDGGDPQAVQIAVNKLRENANDTTVAVQGRYVVLYPKGQEMPKAGTDDDAKPFVELLDKADDAAITTVIIPDAKVREQLKSAVDELPPVFSSMATDLLKSKSLCYSVSSGEKPVLHLAIQAADEGAAKELIRGAQGCVDQLKKTEDQMKTQLGADNPRVQQVDSLVALIKPEAHGSKVTLDLDTPTLKSVGKILLPDLIRAKQQAMQVASAANERQLGQAVMIYANEHDALPNTMDDLAPDVGGKDALAKLLINPNTGDKVGYEYVKPAEKLSQITDAARMPMIYELRDGKRVVDGNICYGDGHVDRGEPHGR